MSKRTIDNKQSKLFDGAKLHEIAIQQSPMEAILSLNREYERVYGNINDARKKPADGWSVAIDNGGSNGEAEYRLGDIFDGGEVVACDEEKARYWYVKAAENGHPWAQFLLGTFYEEGEGVERDIEKAVCWFAKSAEQGNVFSSEKLGLMYQLGDGVDQDDKKAIYWYEKAAEQGSKTAKTMLKMIKSLCK